MKTIKLLSLLSFVLFAEISFSQTKTDSKKTNKSAHFIQVTRDKMQAFQQSFNKSWNKTFTGFSKNEISLYGAINFSKQRINNQCCPVKINNNGG